jgi:ligand-binding sensor domain-containing protein
MQKRFHGAVLLLMMMQSVLGQLPPVGQWREHLSYNQAIAVAASGSSVFAAAPNALFSIDADNEINRYSKINGLHETGVQAIQWDAQAQKLVIVYTNSNIDILSANKVYNIDAIKKKDNIGDKTVNRIYCYQDKAYLSAGLGVIVVDESKYEIKDTYVIGKAGNAVKVNGFTGDGNFFYAATDEGLKKAAINTVNLADYRNWQLSNGFTQPCSNVLTIQNKIVVQKNDSLFALTATGGALLYADDWRILNTTVAEDKLLVSQQKIGNARLLVINSNGVVERTITQNNVLLLPMQAILLQGEVWVADAVSGLLRYSSNNTAQRFQPNSPLSVATGEMATHDGTMWVASGTVTPLWANTFTKNGLYRFSEQEWTNYNSTSIPAFDSLYDLVTVAIDPVDNSTWAGSFGGGLLQLTPGVNTVKVFKQGSPVSPAANDPSRYLVAGLTFDNDNNLWIASYGATQNISVRKQDGTWNKFSPPFALSENAVSQILVDDYNQKWIVSPRGDGLICFNHGQSVENTGDDKWKLYKTGKGNGNLPDNNVLCIAKDKSSFIWVGTMRGIGIVQCAGDIFASQGCDAILPIVQQDNFAGYLFSDEQVQCIAIDGADRKWIGTKNGAWLISADAEKTIYRFTQDNSPLLDNDVKKIVADGQTGEVFFATAKGICSFRGTATEGAVSNSNVFVFPNPVPPAYNGTIAIRGLAENAIVKIAELNGRLVYQTRSLGGQAVWNGKDYNGRIISTGVYLVLVSDDARQEKVATKIVFISK